MPVVLEEDGGKYENSTDDIVKVKVTVSRLIEGTVDDLWGPTVHLCRHIGIVPIVGNLPLEYFHANYSKYVENYLEFYYNNGDGRNGIG
jgi:hypothetical protein